MFIKRVSISVILGILFLSSAFAQEKDNILVYKPVPTTRSIPYPQLRQQVAVTAHNLRKSTYFTELMAYQAIRAGSSSLCSKSADPVKCNELVDNAMTMKAMAEGKCQLIKDKDIAEMCEAVKTNNCAKFNSWRKDACESLVKEDNSSYANKAGSSAGKRAYDTDAADNLQDFAFYAGFKHNSRTACEKFGLKLPMPQKLLCEVVFGEADPAVTLETLALDLAYMSLSKQYGATELCPRITNQDIRRGCLDSSVKQPKDIK